MTNGKKAGELGAPALTYISECNMERRLGRPLDNETNARATSWGNLCEGYVLGELLGLEYSAISRQSIMHPKYDFWSGTPDSLCHEEGEKIITDVKCPFTLKSFCQLVDNFELGGMEAVIKAHKDGAKFFYQLVSNAILTGCNYGELVVFAPYKSELQHLRDMANHDDIGWLTHATDDELPWLPDGGYYKNINKLRFPISEEVKAALTARIELAGQSLVVPVLTS